MKNDKDFTRMFDKKNKLIGCLNFNNMLPVDEYPDGDKTRNYFVNKGY
jgi:hypothetical protein